MDACECFGILLLFFSEKCCNVYNNLIKCNKSNKYNNKKQFSSLYKAFILFFSKLEFILHVNVASYLYVFDIYLLLNAYMLYCCPIVLLPCIMYGAVLCAQTVFVYERTMCFARTSIYD